MIVQVQQRFQLIHLPMVSVLCCSNYTPMIGSLLLMLLCPCHTDTECRYAQIKKEALTITWACEKFPDLIPGEQIIVETGHKPLVPLIGAKVLARLPP